MILKGSVEIPVIVFKDGEELPFDKALETIATSEVQQTNLL